MEGVGVLDYDMTVKRGTSCLFLLVWGLVACSGDVSSPNTQDADTVRQDAVEPPLSVAILPSAFTGNVPIPIRFEARLEGATAEEVAFVWLVDGAQISTEPSFEVVFNRAGASVIELVVRRLDSDGQATGAPVRDTVTLQLLGCADLEFDRFTLDSPTEVPPGGQIRVRYARLLNQGDRIDAPFEVALGLSRDDRWDPAEGLAEPDQLVGSYLVASMPEGLSRESALDLATRAFTLPPDIAPGVYYAFLVADSNATVNECQEIDNFRASTNTLTVDPDAGKLPNLVLSDLDVPDGTVLSQGRILNYTFKLANTGEADARQFRQGFWLSSDTTLDPEEDLLIADPNDESARVQQMPPGLALGFFKSWVVPETLPDGTYYVLGRADALDAVAEVSEDDNAAVSVHAFEMRYEAPQCFDLALASLRIAPLVTYWGGSVQLTAVVRNDGIEPTPEGVVMRAYVGLQQTLSPDNARVLGTFTLGAIPAGGARTFEFLAPIGDDLPVLPHYVSAIIDPTGVWPECSESNNAALYPDPVRVNALAEVDLAISGVAYHPQRVTAGATLKIEYDVTNLGTTSATAFQAGVVLSPDAVVTRAGIASGVDVVVDRVTLPVLAPGDTRHFVRDVVIPVGLDHAVTVWHVGVLADVDGFLSSDRNLSNNLEFSASPLTVEGATGGCFEDAREEDDARAAARVIVEGRLEGLGSCGDSDWFLVDAPAGASLVIDVSARPIVSVPETPSALAVEVYDVSSGSEALRARATLGPDYRAAVYGLASAGTFAVRVSGATARDRASYDLVVTFEEPAPGVDLRAYEALAGPIDAYAGGRLIARWREVNLGLAAAPAHLSRVWLSRDRALDPTLDVLVGAAEVAPLDTFDSDELSVNALIPATLTPGPWYVLIEVDAEASAPETDEDNVVAAGPVDLDPLKVCADDSSEPNDEPAIATMLGRAASEGLNDRVVCPTLPDWYAMDLELGDSATVSIDYNYESARGELVLELWSPRGAGPVLSASREGSARVTLPSAWEAGRWYFRVLTESTPSAAPYSYDLEAARGRGSIPLACTGERYEPNDTLGTAPRIGCGRIEGALCNADVDWYTLPGLAGVRVNIALSGTSQMLAQLFVPSVTNPVATLYGTGTLGYTPSTTGPLYLRLTPRAGDNSLTAFDYALTVTGLDGAEVAVSGLGADLDLVDRGEDLGVAFEVLNQCTLAAPAFDVAAWLSVDDALDAGDIALWGASEAGLEPGAELSFAPKFAVPYSTAPGTYWVIVEADSGHVIDEANELDNRAEVALEVLEPCVADRFEPNDTRAGARAVAAGTTSGLTVCAFDQDWFSIAAPAGAEVTIEARFAQSDGDLDLRVFDPLVSQALPVASSTSTDDDERVVVSTPLATTLAVRVAGYGGASAPYALVVTIR